MADRLVAHHINQDAITAHTPEAATTRIGIRIGSAQQVHDFLNAPHVVRYASFHRGRHAQRLMNPPEVVIHEVECHGGGMILDLFEKAFVSLVKLPMDIRMVRLCVTLSAKPVGRGD